MSKLSLKRPFPSTDKFKKNKNKRFSFPTKTETSNFGLTFPFNQSLKALISLIHLHSHSLRSHAMQREH